MKVTVKLFGEFRTALGVAQLELDLPEGTTCGDALRTLGEQEPALGGRLFDERGLRNHLHVFVNGRNVAHLGGLGTVLSPGDTLAFFPPISGG